ncbi:MAG: GntR family transcriptional regulator [Sphaerochaeta sp.]|nr:GntR family transcriptional regulator [Sphaerochaeta sp.]
MVQSKDVSEMIFSTLKNEILELTIKPGQLMTENSLCERFSVSRTPVHVALQRLSDAGLLEMVPYKGVRSTLLRFDDVRQTISMRIILEVQAICDFIDIDDPFYFEDCQHNLRKQEILLASEGFTPATFYQLDSKLHQIWFERVRLPKIWDMIQEFEVYYTRFKMLDIVEMHDFQGIYSEHAQLLDLIKNKRKDQVRALITYHMYGGIRRLFDKLGGELAPYFEDSDEMESFIKNIRTFERP